MRSDSNTTKHVILDPYANVYQGSNFFLIDYSNVFGEHVVKVVNILLINMYYFLRF